MRYPNTMNQTKLIKPGRIPTGRYTSIAFCVTIVLLLSACSILPPSPIPEKTGTAKSGSAAAYTSPITGITWLLAGYSANGIFIPLEPGQGTTGRIVFKADGTLTGTTGINTFAGVWKIKSSSQRGINQFTVSLSDISKKTAPNDIAIKFDRDVIAYLAKTRTLQIEKDSIKLFDERNETLLRFIFLESDRN